MLTLKGNLNFLTVNDATEITPVMAQALLDNSRCIKPIRKSDVSRLVNEFKNDNFEFNGATITLDCDGCLIDGQTRLTACVQANMSFKTFIVHGVNLEGQYTKDTGRGRNVVQYLASNEYKYPRALSASAQILRNIMLAMDDDTKDGIIEVNNVAASHQEIIDIIKSEPNLQECVNRIFPERTRYVTNAIYHVIVLDYLHRYVYDKPKMADEFAAILSGVRVDDIDHPVSRLRARFIGSVQHTNTKLKKTKQIKYLIKAYNLLDEGKYCKGLQINRFTPRLNILADKGNS